MMIDALMWITACATRALKNTAADISVTDVDTPAALAIRTTIANGTMLSIALRCARLARFTQAGNGEVGATWVECGERASFGERHLGEFRLE